MISSHTAGHASHYPMHGPGPKTPVTPNPLSPDLLYYDPSSRMVPRHIVQRLISEETRLVITDCTISSKRKIMQLRSNRDGKTD